MAFNGSQLNEQNCGGDEVRQPYQEKSTPEIDILKKILSKPKFQVGGGGLTIGGLATSNDFKKTRKHP